MEFPLAENIFQHKNISGITRAVSEIVLHDAGVEEAETYLS